MSRTLEQLVRQDGLEMEFKTHPDRPPEHMAYSWLVTLRFPRRHRELVTPFHVGSERDPELVEVVECLLSDASSADQTFEQYCEEFSLNEDSRRELATFEAMRAAAAELKEFLGWALYEQYLHAQR